MDPSTVSSTALSSPSTEDTKLSGQNAYRVHSKLVPLKTTMEEKQS